MPTDSDDKVSAQLLSDNLKAARRLYYLIITVALFIIVTLLENDPARVPVLNRAWDLSQRYDATRRIAQGTWTELVGIARGQEKASDPSYVKFYSQATTVTGVSWLNLADCSATSTSGGKALEQEVTLVWEYLASLEMPGSPVVSINSEGGASEITVTTEHPSVDAQSRFLECFSRIVEGILRRGNLYVEGTTSGGGEYSARLLARQSPTGASPDPADLSTADVLKVSPVFARIAFALNRDKLSPTYFNTLNNAFRDLRTVLSSLGIWETATTAAYNPSLVFKGQTYEASSTRDDAFLNDEALRKVTADLKEDIRTRSTKLKIPLTSYSARIDWAVIFTGIILVFLHLAYYFTLRSVAILAPKVPMEIIAFFPWPVLWQVHAPLDRKSTARQLFRAALAGLTVAHSLLGACVLGWVVVTMLRWRSGLLLEILLSVSCCFVTAVIGYYSLRCVRRIRAAMS